MMAQGKHNSMKYKRLFIVVFLCSFVCLFITGCFKGSADVSVQENGSVIVHNKIVGEKIIADEIEKIKKNAENKSNAKITKVDDGSMSGYEIEIEYASMEDFAKNSDNIYKTHEGKCKGIQEHKGWFFDAYRVDLFQEGDKKGTPNNGGGMDSMLQAMLSQIKFDFTWNLPYPADENNADSVSNEGKTLYWNLASTLSKGEDKQIQMQFKIWHKDHIAVTVVVAVLLCILLAFLLWKAMKNNECQHKKGMMIGAVLIACMLLGVGGVSAYMIFSPVKFTDSDIISTKYEASEKDEETQEPQYSKKQETPKLEKKNDTANDSLSNVQAVLQKYGIDDTVEATSYGHNIDGSLSITRTKHGKRMFLIDEKNRQVAFVEFTSDVYGFVNNRGKSHIPPVIFKVSILNDVRGADKSLGIWNGDDHIFEIYAVYKFDEEGKVVPGMLTSGAGAKPSHYQAYLNEQKNVDLANLFLTEMQSLHSDANRRGLDL